MVHSVAMSARARNTRVSPTTVISSRLRTHQPLPKSVRLSQLGKMCECEQVAAVCYRIRRGAIEFLLVETRGSGRWIFPKGSAEPGLTHAQAAAIEAVEEAGVHGRIEEAAFARYVCRRQSNRHNAGRSAAKAFVVSAHLCEVRRLCHPKEPNRNRTWFSVNDATQCLQKGRKNEDAEEFVRVVQKAVARIEQLRIMANAVAGRLRRQEPQQDELHKVQFEARPDTRRPLEQARRFTLPSGQANAGDFLPCEVLPFDAPRQSSRSPRLLSSAVKRKALGSGAGNA
jgi:8-oxo-dGTP pyrophosphatase MutT (NUDIX family)